MWERHYTYPWIQIQINKLVKEAMSYLSLKLGKSFISFFLRLEGDKSITRWPSRILVKDNLCRNNFTSSRIKQLLEVFRPYFIRNVCDKQVICYWLPFHLWRYFLLFRLSIFDIYYAAVKLLRNIQRINK